LLSSERSRVCKDKHNDYADLICESIDLWGIGHFHSYCFSVRSHGNSNLYERKLHTWNGHPQWRESDVYHDDAASRIQLDNGFLRREFQLQRQYFLSAHADGKQGEHDYDVGFIVESVDLWGFRDVYGDHVSFGGYGDGDVQEWEHNPRDRDTEQRKSDLRHDHARSGIEFDHSFLWWGL
jgi:hypothetical protein